MSQLSHIRARQILQAVVILQSFVQTRSSQAALEKKVGMLETHQREIHEALLSMENEAARLYQVSWSYIPSNQFAQRWGVQLCYMS